MNLEVRLKDVLQQIKSDTHLLRKREMESGDMKIGCISYCFKGGKLEDMLGKFRGVGFKNVELWQGYKGHLSIEYEVEGGSTKDLKESLKFCSEVLGKEEKS